MVIADVVLMMVMLYICCPLEEANLHKKPHTNSINLYILCRS